MAFLEVLNLSKKFDSVDAIKDVSFSLEKGEVLSIIGSSGSGKTTTLRCLNFLETASEGKIILNGETLFDGKEKIKESSVRKRRIHFGLVFQSFILFPQYTAFQNIKLPLSLREKERMKNGEKYLQDEEIDNIVYDLLKKVGLEAKASSYPHELSGGQKQRIAIARTVALDPDILCFDEPTSALDPLLTLEVLKVIKSIKKLLNKTIIIVTHEMEFAKNISDKVIFMHEGEIIESGTSNEIFCNPKSTLLKQFLESSKNI